MITLEELIALNDEILALSRAGIPLEQGLLEIGHDLPKRLGKIATQLGDRLEKGESLNQVLSDKANGFPPLYCALVNAGIRSGRLSQALEGIATTFRRLAELRSMTGLALIYPMIVICLACILFAFSLQPVFSGMLSTYAAQQLDSFPHTEASLRFLASHAHWVAWLPLLMLAIAAVWWLRSGRAAAAQPNGLERRIIGVPGARRLLHTGRVACFVEVLRLLLDQQVSLPESLRLAARASGDPDIMADAEQLSAKLSRGERIELEPRRNPGIPPLITWMILADSPSVNLSNSLHSTADSYFRRTQYQVDRLRIYLPIWSTLAFAGTVTCVYALVFLLPWFQLLARLAQSTI